MVTTDDQRQFQHNIGQNFLCIKEKYESKTTKICVINLFFHQGHEKHPC